MDITPNPEAEERAAILAALADDEAEQQPLSPWVQSVLPDRSGEPDEP